jgi:hypothetical protein
MIKRAPTSPTADPDYDRHTASAAVEDVRTRCPALIAALVAIAREAKDHAKLVTERADSEHR